MYLTYLSVFLTSDKLLFNILHFSKSLETGIRHNSLFFSHMSDLYIYVPSKYIDDVLDIQGPIKLHKIEIF